MDQVVGHSEIKQRFAQAVAQQRLPSTFLFVGPEGVGKMKFAWELSKALLCLRSGDTELTSCGVCESCRLFGTGLALRAKLKRDYEYDVNSHPDFKYIYKRPDKGHLLIRQFIGEDERRMKEGLVHDMSLRPSLSTRKVGVIDDGDYFNVECANCLLKTLEEPPRRSVLIIVGNSEQKQLPTIRSRCQIIRFAPLTVEEIREVLERMPPEQLPAPVEELVEHSGGSLEVLEWYRQDGLMEFRKQLYAQLASCDPTRDRFAADVQSFVEQAGKEGAAKRNRVRQLADFAIQFYRAVGKALLDLTVEGDSTLKICATEAAHIFAPDPELAADCVSRCLDLQEHVVANANFATMLECWLSDLGKLSRGERLYSEIHAEWSY